jgi:pyrimidine deaminase RibD-like protein
MILHSGGCFAVTDDADAYWLERAAALAHLCPPVDTAYCVGAIVVDAAQCAKGARAAPHAVLATGYSRELDGNTHAEEVCFAKMADAATTPRGAVLYTTMEPCSVRLSGKESCTARILRLRAALGIVRVVYALREPADIFVQCHGAEILAAAGIRVCHMPQLSGLCWAPNRNLRESHNPTPN